MNRLNDIQLFALVQKDDRKAFTEIVNRYSTVLFRFVYKRVSNVEDTKDILQEIFTSFWNRRHQIHIQESLYPYLFQSAKYQIIDCVIKQKKGIERVSMLVSMQDVYFLKLTHTSEDELIAKEIEQQIDSEVNKMPATMRDVFTLSRKQAMSIREIALTLSVSEQTVKNNISLAISRLKGVLK